MAKVLDHLLCQAKINETVACVNEAILYWARSNPQHLHHPLIVILHHFPKPWLQFRNLNRFWQLLGWYGVALGLELISEDFCKLGKMNAWCGWLGCVYSQLPHSSPWQQCGQQPHREHQQ